MGAVQWPNRTQMTLNELMNAGLNRGIAFGDQNDGTLEIHLRLSAPSAVLSFKP